MFDVEYKTLGLGDVTNGYFSLLGTPIDNTNVALDIIGGTAQYLSNSGDFVVNGTKVIWDGTNLVLDINDRVRVIYDRS
jgi:hypothetical protein